MTILPDILKPNLKVVFCGTAVGNRSAVMSAYYAGPGNRFWPTLFSVGLTPRQLEPHEYASLLDHGLGLTDLAKKVSGLDNSLKSSDFDIEQLVRKIEQYRPGVLAFNGKKAATIFFVRKKIDYGLQPESFGGTAIFVLPSTSRAASGFCSGQGQVLHRCILRCIARSQSAANSWVFLVA